MDNINKQNSTKPAEPQEETTLSFPEEHVSDVEKITRFLEKVKNSRKTSSDKRAFNDLQVMCNSFQQYLKKQQILLERIDKKEIMAITGAAVDVSMKKRMIEDIIVRVKERSEADTRQKLAKLDMDKEIAELQPSRSFLRNWLRLTRFAFKYRTITLFSHKYKDTNLAKIRDKVMVWQNLLERSILNILDSEHYTLSTMEYNALRLILDLRTPCVDIKNIPYDRDYIPKDIAIQMDAFARIYFTLVKNTALVEVAARKAFKKKKADQGFLGVMKNLLDRPVYNNKPVKWNAVEKMKNSITGLLLSYYSARQSVVLRTINQALYILTIDGEVDSEKKNLTEKAKKQAEKKQKQKYSRNEQNYNKLKELKRVTETFLQTGHTLENKMFKVEAKNMFEKWKEEHEEKPMLRLLRLLDLYIKFFIDPINDDHYFVLLYDNSEYRGFFAGRGGIDSITAEYSLPDFELVGSKITPVISMKTGSGSSHKQFFSTLTDSDVPDTTHGSKLKFVRSIVQAVSNKSYQLGLGLNQLISDYEDQKEVVFPDETYNYDFYTSAIIGKTKSIQTHRLYDRADITLSDFLEASSTLAFHIARELNHPGIEAIIKDRKTLQLEIDSNRVAAAAITEDEDEDEETVPDIVPAAIDGIGDDVLNEINDIYKDSHTGLWKTEYFTEQVIPRLYDEEQNYKLNIHRIVFYCGINGLTRFNSQFGQSRGDQLQVDISRKIAGQITRSRTHKNDIVIKYTDGNIVGYINNSTLTRAAEILAPIISDIKSTTLPGKDAKDMVSINMGLYHEKHGTNVYYNIDVGKKIMVAASVHGTNNIAFLKNPGHIVSTRDFNRFGDIEQHLITVSN
ncbi:MAG: diguanylate cyclase [bacterium]|nr:diguanylate cyclase [bacterium]